MRLGVLAVGSGGVDLTVVDAHIAPALALRGSRSFALNLSPHRDEDAGLDEDGRELLIEAVGSAALAAARAGCADLVAYADPTDGRTSLFGAVLDEIHRVVRVRVRALGAAEIGRAELLASGRWPGPGPCSWGAARGADPAAPRRGRGGRVSIPIGLSTASVYPEPTAWAFRRAAELGYDGVEVFVWTDEVSQSADALADLVQTYQVPVLSVHAPCVVMTSRVWGTDPLVKLSRSVDLAQAVDATTVVTHPPFVWQRAAAQTFSPAVAELQDRTPVRIAVENMFPARVGGSTVSTYRPHWDPVVGDGHRWYTLDLSHTATAGDDALAMYDRMGDRLGHLHLADGTDSPSDEHLVPGRGGQPCGQILELLADSDFDGAVIVEVTTRKRAPADRELDLAEALSFARLHLAA